VGDRLIIRRAARFGLGDFRRFENTRAELFIRNQNPGCAHAGRLVREALTFLKNS
jgi:hypothetical protein